MSKKGRDHNSHKIFLITCAVLVVAIAVALLFLPSAFDRAQQNQQARTPTGSFTYFEMINPREVRVHLGAISPSTNFFDCDVKVTPPNQDSTVVKLKANTVQYTAGTTSITSLSTSTSGVIKPDDYISLSDAGSLPTGVWKVNLIFRSSGGTIAEKNVVVPSTTTPIGSFTSAYFMDASHARVMFGVTTPSTPFSYCTLTVQAPDSTTFVWKVNTSQSISYIANATVTLFIADIQGDGLINAGDYLGIVTTEPSLASGNWLVTLTYNFNNDGRIASTQFQSL